MFCICGLEKAWNNVRIQLWTTLKGLEIFAGEKTSGETLNTASAVCASASSSTIYDILCVLCPGTEIFSEHIEHILNNNTHIT